MTKAFIKQRILEATQEKEKHLFNGYSEYVDLWQEYIDFLLTSPFLLLPDDIEPISDCLPGTCLI